MSKEFFFEEWEPNVAKDTKAFFYTDDEGRVRFAGGPGSGGGSAGSSTGAQQGFYKPTSKQDAKLRAAESGIIAKPIEECFVVNAKGEVIFTKTGEKSEINFTQDESSLMNNNTFTHNHPSGGSFSPQDIIFAAASNMSSVRAVGVDYAGTKRLYEMRRPSGGWPSELKLQSEFLRVVSVYVAKEENKNWGLIDAGKLSIPDAGLQHWHNIMTEIATTYGLSYLRTEL